MNDVSTAPLVSVIVPAYNMAAFLPDAVASVRRQTWMQLEIIIVDDGSTDGTGDLAERLRTEDSRVRIVRKANGGPSSARNAGIEALKGEFVCFLDADDIMLPDKMERQMAFLNLFPSCDLVYSDYYIGDSTLTPIGFECTLPPNLPTRGLLAYRCPFAPMSPLMRSRLVAKTGAFDEALFGGEDWEYWIRAARFGVFSYLPGPIGVYRTHPGQGHNNRNLMRENQEKVIRKHFPYGSQEWRVARASVAWADAKHAWGERNLVTMAAKMVQAGWYARSWPIFRNVIHLSRYG